MHDGDDTFGDSASAPEGGPPQTGALPPWTPPDPASASAPPPTATPLPPPPPAPSGPVPPPTSDPSTWVLPAGPPPAPLPYGPSTTAPPPGSASPARPGAGAPPPGAPTWSPAGAGSAPPAPPGWSPALPVYGAAPPPPPHVPATKGRSRAALAILSVTAVLAATTFAVVALTRPDGSASAEEAVEKLFGAIEQEDAIGVMESLPPGEREVLLDPLVATVGELQRLGLLDSFALEDVPGADIEVDGLTLQSTNLGPGITKVRVTGGTITGTVIPDEVPIGPKASELAERETGEPIDVTAETGSESLADLELVAVEEDGGWHVSLFYSIAEGIRGDETPLPQFGAGLIAPVGSDSPEGAVRGLVEAGLALDLGRAVGHLPPDEMRVAYDYVPLFLDDADEAADEARDDGYQASLDRLDLHAEGDGETRRVSIDGLDVTAGAGDSTVHYAWDGSCTLMEVTEPRYSGTFTPIDPDTGGFDDPLPPSTEPTTMRFEACTDGRVTVTEDGEEVDDDDLFGPLGTGSIGPGPFGPMSPLGGDAELGQTVTVVEHDGRWYVSPTRTVLDSMLGALRGLDGSDLDRFFDSLDEWWTPTERFEPVGEPIPGPSGTVVPTDPNDPYTVCADLWYDLGPDATDDEWDAATEGYDQCLRDYGIDIDAIEDAYLSEPRFVGGTVVALAADRLRGFARDGNAVWDGPTCDNAGWADLDEPAAAVTTVAVVTCDTDVVDVVAVDPGTGTEIWRRPMDDLGTVDVGSRALVQWGLDGLAIVDLSTGQQLWAMSHPRASSVTSDDTTVYVATADAVEAYELSNGAKRWTAPAATTAIGVVPGGLITRADGGEVRRLDPLTGDTVWSNVTTDPSLASIEEARVVGANAEVVVLVSDEGSNTLFVHDLATGELLWTNDGIDEWSSIAVTETNLVASDPDLIRAVVLDPRTGRAKPFEDLPPNVWSFDVDGSVLAYTVEDDDGTSRIATVTLPG